MEMMQALQEYIKPELLVLVPLMFGLGAALKADKRFPSANIPYTLAVAGMALAALYGAATAQLDGWQSVALAVFTAIVQGGLCALASVGLHQMYKQAKEKKEELEHFILFRFAELQVPELIYMSFIPFKGLPDAWPPDA